MYAHFLQEMLDVFAIERSVLGGNVRWDLRIMSTIERCPL